MSKIKKGLAIDRDVEDPMRRPRPVSQEGFYYSEDNVYDKNSLHPNSKRQPMRQYGSSASLEVRHEHNRQQREQEFFTTSPSATPKQEHSRNASPMQPNVYNTDSLDYQRSGRQINNHQYHNKNLPSPSNYHLPPQNNINSGGIMPNLNLPSNSRGPHSNVPYNSRSIVPHSINPTANQNYYSPQPSLSNNSHTTPIQHQTPPIRKDSHGSSQHSINSRRPTSQESLADPFSNAHPYRPPQNSRGIEQNQNFQIPPGHRNQSQQQHYSSKNQNNAKGPPIVNNNNNNNNNSQHLKIEVPMSIDDYVLQAIKYHENDQLEKSTKFLKIAAEHDSPVGMVLYGIALRHGWGCKVDAALAFKYLKRAADSAMDILKNINNSVMTSSFKGELILAIYELGVCFRHGWGVPKSKATAAYYFEIAANLGDPDAQNDIALCYYKGEGVKRDMKTAAKYYRMADAQGHGTMGNSWIFKEKYNDDKK